MRTRIVSLPVADLVRATRVLTALGFTVDATPPGAGRAHLVAEPAAVLVLVLDEGDRDEGGRDEARDGEGRGGEGRWGGRVIARLAADSRLAVDRAFARALVAGGRPWRPLTDDGATYACSVLDPDGHVWEVAYEAPAAGRAGGRATTSPAPCCRIGGRAVLLLQV